MLFRIKWSLIGLVALFCVQAAANGPQQPEIPVPIKDCNAALAAEVRPRVNLSIWRYYGQPNYNSVHHMNLSMAENGLYYNHALLGWANESGHYVPVGETSARQFDESHLKYMNPLRDEKNSGGEGEVVFERLQYYSLKLMEKINYLDAGSRRNYVQNSRNLHPNQVTLFEATEQLPESELIIKYGKIPEGARRDAQANSWSDYQQYFDHSLLYDPFDDDGKPNPPYVAPKPNPIYEVKVGVSWLVSGQDVDRHYAIPSEDDDLETKIDREKYKFIWEVGRAGQAMSGAYEETLRASAYQAYWEVLALGGKIEDAYVFAHSLDAIHTRLFRSKFGMKDFSKYKGKPTERCMVAPLSEFLRRYPPETYSSEVAQIVEDSEGKISGIEAMRMIFNHRTKSDVRLKAGGGEIQIRNFNGAEPPYEPRDLITRTAEYGDSHMNTANRFPVQGIFDSRTGKLQPLREFLHSHGALEVSPSKFTGSAKELLATAMAHAQRKRPLHEHTRICVTTSSGQIIKELREMGPMAHWYVSRGRYVSMNGFGFGMGGGYQTIASPIHLESLCFLVKDLKDLPKVSLPDTSKDDVKRWLTDPEFYTPAN